MGPRTFHAYAYDYQQARNATNHAQDGAAGNRPRAGPSRHRCALSVKDAFVSRDHLRVEERPGRKVKVANLSTKAPVTVDGHAVLNPGTDADYVLPGAAARSANPSWTSTPATSNRCR